MTARTIASRGGNRKAAQITTTLRMISAINATGCLSFGARHEYQALEQVNVLLVLQQRSVQRRDDRLAVLGAQRFRGDVLGQQELQPVEQLAGGGLLLQPRHLAHLEKDFERLS